MLSRGEIRAALETGELIIDPYPDYSAQLQPASIDLRLGPELLVHQRDPVPGLLVDPTEVQVMDHIRRYCQSVDISGTPGYHPIPPNGFVLGKTLERVEIPLNLSAWVEGKSSLARYGMTVHITAPKIDPGFEGNITLEMFNHGPFTLKLSYGMDICALMFEQLILPAGAGYAGRFQD